jgi:hypothetical protein
MFECVGCSCWAARARLPQGETLARGGWRPAAAGVWDVLTDKGAPRTDWSINEMLAIELAAYLDRVRPRRILEVGSGYSTTILGAYAAYHDAEVVTLEHDPKYFRTTRRALRRFGVDRRLDLRLAPLRHHWFGDHGPYCWYGVALEGDFDFVFIDGPPKVLGRRGAFFALQGHLRPGWRIWVDDGFRKHEQHSVRLWEKSFAGEFVESCWDIDGKGVFVLSDASGAHEQAGNGVTPDRLGIGILGNGDPTWWEQAERVVGEQFLCDSYVVAVDGQGPPGQPLPAAAAGFVDRRLPSVGGLPERMVRMFRSLTIQAGVRYVLYLDDRWSPSTLDTSWLRRGLNILEEQPDVEQVFLRHLVDLDVPANGGQRPFPGSFTHEPCLLRADRLGTALQRAPLWTVQLSPGVFHRRGSEDRLPEAAVHAEESQPLPVGGVVRQAARSLVAAVGNLRGSREDGLENGLVDLTAATVGRPARRV